MSMVTRALVVAGAASVLLAAAGCGGGGNSPSVASIGGTTTSSSQSAGPPAGSASSASGGANLTLKLQNGEKFAQCMRSHGIPNFPDPSSGGAISIGPGSGIDPSSPKFQQATAACDKLLPNGGQPSPQQIEKMQKAALAFSACMRKHGLTDFPDPTFSGGGAQLRIRVGSSSDLNPSSPIFQAAQKACQGDLPGKFGGGK